jgi:hypothetical protein
MEPDSAGPPLRIQLARKSCNVRGQRIDRDGGKELFDERFAARAPFGGVSTWMPVRVPRHRQPTRLRSGRRPYR